MEMTHRWLDRCIQRLDETAPRYGHTQHLFPIVQGSTFKDLRQKSAEEIASREAEGNAIGGLSVGEPHEDMYATTELVCGILPEDKPRYLMGVGTPVNILENIGLGVDMFDCVLPTRNARHGMLYTWDGVINIRNRKWAQDFSPLDPGGTSPVDSFYSKAYVRHLLHVGEFLSWYICSVHNLAFYMDLVRQARAHIVAGDFDQWKRRVSPKLAQRL
jgi:queuine tRNA-ribosyltransferase